MINAKAVLIDRKSSPVDVIHVLDRELGEEWKFWEPEVLWDEISIQTGINLAEHPRGLRDKIMAIRLLLKTNVPWQDWHPFLATALSLNGVSPDVETAQTIPTTYLAYAVSVMRRLEPYNEFDRDVKYMMAALLVKNGIYWVPPWPMGDIIWAQMDYFQEDMDQEAFANEARKDYALVTEHTDLDVEHPIRMHTVKLLAMDHYLEDRKTDKDLVR